MVYLLVFLLGLGFIGLYFGAKLVVMSLEDIASHFKMSKLLVGLTILAIGTSLPEIAVGIMGGIDKLTGIEQNIDGIVIGNKIGSFIVNITLIIGILALTKPIFVIKWELKREGIMLFISLMIFLLFAIDGVFTRLEAFLMILIYIAYLFLIIRSERRIEKLKHDDNFYEKEEIDQNFLEPIELVWKGKSIKIDICIFLLGLLILLIAAELTLIAALYFAEELNIPPNVIGVLIVGVGTSIPELSADLMAIKRKSEEIAVGDLLGSNICDLLLATGVGAIISEFYVANVLIIYDIPMCFIAAFLAYYFLWTEKALKRWEALLLISFFGMYAILKIVFFQI